MHTIAQLYHAFDALNSGSVQLRLHHPAVLAVVNTSVHNGIAVILHIWVGGNRCVDFFAFAQLRQLRLGVLSSDMGDRFVKLLGEVCTLNRLNGEVLFSVLCAFGGLTTEYHFGMLNEIAVDGETVFVLTEVYPIRLNAYRAVSLLQEDDVADYIRSGICPESIVRKTNCTEEIGSLCDILTNLRRLLVHGIARCDECHNTTGANLIQ